MAVFQYILSLTLWEFLYHTVGCYYLVLSSRFLILTSWNLIKEIIPLENLLNKYSQPSSQQCWAVITGATDGIGLGFAQVLTQLGFDICLISRNQQKLKKTAQDLQLRRPQHFKHKKITTIQFNYADSADKEKFTQMISTVKNLDIGILVNNVGTSELKQYENFCYEEIKRIININCTSMAVMTQQLLPEIIKRKSKTAIINLSSFAGQAPLPYVTLYSATKAMNTFFSEALSLENRALDILSVRPMFVESPLSRAKKGFNIPDRRQCAWACLKELKWTYETNGYWMHRVLASAHQLFVPQWAHRIVTKRAVHRKISQYQ